MRFTYCSGQTIAEMLVVLFIISLGLYGAVTIIFSNVRLQEQDRDYILAMNLGREALELAQNVRDSNWLAGRPIEDGLGIDTGDCTAVADDLSFFFAPDDLSEAEIYRSEELGIQATGALGADQIPFFRLVTFSPICFNPAGHEMPSACKCPPGHVLIGVRVRVDMQWDRQGVSRSLTLYSDLYDWR